MYKQQKQIQVTVRINIIKNKKYMQVVKSVRVRLTMGDIQQHIVHLTKQQMISQFKLLLDRKQVQINQKIQTNNAQHLLVLQKKMLVLEKKDDQIVKLNNMLSSYKNQLQEVSLKNSDMSEQLIQSKLKCAHYEKKYNQYDAIYKEEKAKREKLKKQLQKLTAQHKVLTQDHQVQVRNHKKIKDQKVGWHQQTQYLLNNLKKKHQQQLESKLKNIKNSLQNKISQLEYTLQEQKRKHESYKQKYNESKKNNQSLKRVIDMLNKQLENEKIKAKKMMNDKQFMQIQTQTDSSLLKAAFLAGNSIFMQFMADRLIGKTQKQQKPKKEVQKVEKSIQAQVFQCSQCKNLKNTIQNLEIQLKTSKPTNSKKQQKIRTMTAAVQVTPPPPPVKQDGQSQTTFTPLTPKQQLYLIQSFQTVSYTSHQIIESWQRKYEQLEILYDARPARQQDRYKIRDLQRQLIQYQLKDIQSKSKIEKLLFLNNQLRNKIAQQKCFIENVNMDAVQIRNLNKTVETSSQNIKKSFNSTSPAFRLNTISRQKRSTTRPISTSQKTRSLSLDITEVRNGQFSLQLRGQKQSQFNNSNVIQLNNFSITEQQQQFQRSSRNNYEKLNNILLEKGISFKQNDKKAIKQQMSEARRYKKFKGILSKGKF